MSFQTLNALYRAQDVKSGTLEKIAQVYGKDIRWFYGLDKEQPVENQTLAKDSSITTLSEKFIKLLEEKDKQIAALLKLVADKKD